jgi:hypothetical protein
MAQKVRYPTKTPDKKKKVSQEEREKGGFGMVEKEGITYPPARKEVKTQKKWF